MANNSGSLIYYFYFLLDFSSLLIGLCNIRQLVAHVIRLVRILQVDYLIYDFWYILKVDDFDLFYLQLSCMCWCLCLAYSLEVVPLSF